MNRLTKNITPIESNKIIVVGLGYVGLTFALFLTKLGFKVYAIEKNLKFSDELNMGKTEILDEGLQEALLDAIQNKRLVINDNFENSESRNIFVVTVGTPIESNESSLNQVNEVKSLLNKLIQDNDLIILRSTLKIGTSQKFYEDLSQTTGKNFSLAMCPERTVEGNALIELASLPQIISGVNQKSLDDADQFFSNFGVETVRVENTSTAELIKLATNTYRDLNFAFGNEIALIAENYGIDAWAAIKFANYNYPRSQIQFPGLTGGPCLEKDPHILAISAREVGIEAKITLAARITNLLLPEESLQKILRHPKYADSIRKNFLILGLAFKGSPPTRDTRGSMAFAMRDVIKKRLPEIRVTGWDPLVINCSDLELEEDLSSALTNADVIIIQNNNKELLRQFKLQAKANIKKGVLIYDFWNVLSKKDLPEQSNLISLGKIL